MAAIAFKSGASIKGPFLIERAMLFRLPLHDKLVGALIVSSLVTESRLAPRRHRVIPLHATFTTAMRVIDRIHDHAANGRTYAQMPDAAGLSECHLFVVEVANLPDRRDAIQIDQPDLARRQLHMSKSSFLRNELRCSARAARHL